MSAIHEEIQRAIVDCQMSSGKPAAAIYLGGSQMDRLMRWAKKNDYISDTSLRTGKHRPEVMGIPVYEVNSENHCVAACDTQQEQ